MSSEDGAALGRGLRIVRAAGPAHGHLLEASPGLLEAAESRGYFKPEEDGVVRLRYAQYLAERSSLVAVLRQGEPACGPRPADWRRQPALFVMTLAAACLLVGGARRVCREAEASRLLRKKLDEPDPVHGVPAKTLAGLYRTSTAPWRLARLVQALEWFDPERPEFRGLAGCPDTAAAIELIERSREALVSTGSHWQERLRYRWFSFRRRHHSAWKKSVFGLFQWSGSWIADLHQPGIKPPGVPRSSAYRQSPVGLPRSPASCARWRSHPAPRDPLVRGRHSCRPRRRR